MAETRDNDVRVEYEYIKHHQRVWEKELAAYLEHIARLTQQLAWQHTNVKFLKTIMSAHERVIDLVRDRTTEGITANYHIAGTMAEIVEYYRSHESFAKALLRTGGLD